MKRFCSKCGALLVYKEYPKRYDQRTGERAVIVRGTCQNFRWWKPVITTHDFNVYIYSK